MKKYENKNNFTIMLGSVGLNILFNCEKNTDNF